MTSEEIFQRAQDAIRDSVRAGVKPPSWAWIDMKRHQKKTRCEHCDVEIYGIEVIIQDGHWLCEECAE